MLRIKEQQFIDTGTPWFRIRDAGVEIGRLEFPMKHIMPIGSERVRISETVTGKFLTLVDKNRVSHRRSPLVVCYRCSIPDNARCITTTVRKWRSTFIR